MSVEEQLLAVSPIDGRYANRVEPLSRIVSEFGLIERRLQVAVGWVSTLGGGVLPDVIPISDRGQDKLGSVSAKFDIEDAVEIKAIESTTNHDANAVVRFLKERLGDDPDLAAYAELVHFGCTSEDMNNLAFALMVRDVRDRILLPNLGDITNDLGAKSREYADLAMLSRTHGQPASPTTLGKEMAVFEDRLVRHIVAIGSVSILGKFSGATGNYNAGVFAYPEVDWPTLSREFVESFGFEYNGVTTQIEPHDWMARFFNEVALGNSILTDITTDDWLYIMLKQFAQRVNPDEDGSSAMPNKVNPIDFENAEANFSTANALFGNLAANLPMSRLQRDLRDSSRQRTMAEAFGHTLIGHASIKKGLGKIYPNETQIAADLDAEWTVLAEAAQTIMRRYGVTGAYDVIKKASRGRALTEEDWIDLVRQIDLPDEVKDRLLNLTPSTYVGLAPDIARKHN